MSKRGVPIKAEVREKIRQGQLARWERIRAQLAQAEIHEKHCEDEHLTNMVHPRFNTASDEESNVEKMERFLDLQRALGPGDYYHDNNDRSLWAELKSWLGGKQ